MKCMHKQRLLLLPLLVITYSSSILGRGSHDLIYWHVAHKLGVQNKRSWTSDSGFVIKLNEHIAVSDFNCVTDKKFFIGGSVQSKIKPCGLQFENWRVDDQSWRKGEQGVWPTVGLLCIIQCKEGQGSWTSILPFTKHLNTKTLNKDTEHWDITTKTTTYRIQQGSSFSSLLPIKDQNRPTKTRRELFPKNRKISTNLCSPENEKLKPSN